MKAIRNVTLLSLSLLALALLTVAPAAYANSISYTTIEANAPDNLSSEIVLPAIYQFNTSLGTLTSATITFVGSGQTTLTATTSTSSAATGVTITSDTTLTLLSTVSAINSVLAANGFTTDADDVTAGIAHQTVPGHTTYYWGESGLPSLNPSVTPYTMASDGGTSVTLASGLGIFESGSPSSLGFELDSNAGVVSGSHGGAATLGQANNESGGTVTVIYDYTPGGPPVVPEPGTLTLFGTGLLGLAGLLRRKFMQSR
jgi:hypothetical protein